MNVDALHVGTAMIAATGIGGLAALVLLSRRDRRFLEQKPERIRRP